jgi:[acyl-carrier-protein] S-malonyltransferase
MTTAFIFPGQGSQTIGMGKALADAFPSARAVFQEIDEALGQTLSRLMWSGAQEDLTLTENAQPALMAVSLAAMAALKTEFGVEITRAAYVAGHSLGEYAALAAAGSLSITDAAKLLKLRGQAMQRAVPVGQGAMAALIGADIETAEAAAQAGSKVGVCAVANDNAPGQVVISGAKAAVEAANAHAATLGVKRALMLPVSAPFHCPLMQPAADEMAKALAAVTLNAPRVPLFANVTAAAVTEPDVIRKLLVEQVCGRVRWRESVANMASAGVTQFVEIGAGKVLTGMIKRIAEGATGVALGEPADLEAFAKGVVAV